MRLASLCVIVFALSSLSASAQATEQVLYSFGGYQFDGIVPNSNLVADRAGNLYGTTALNTWCSGCNVIYELSPNSNGTWTESVLYTFWCDDLFQFCADGVGLYPGLTIDSAGNLYGTTGFGGAASCPYFDKLGCGVAFELSPPGAGGGNWTYTVIYVFCSVGAYCQDGAGPGPLTIDVFGNLYGSTDGGGQNQVPNFTGGAGTIFELSRASGTWTESVLYNFCSVVEGSSCLDGDVPLGPLSIDKIGNFYGTTYAGGNPGSSGVVFKLLDGPDGWTENVLRQIVIPPDLETDQDVGPLSVDQKGNLYTTFTYYDRQNYTNGFVVKLTPGGGGAEFRFDGSKGRGPIHGVIIDPKGDLYGVTGGSSNGPGNVFEIGAGGKETVLYNFCQQSNCADGSIPGGGLYEDGFGNLFGVTSVGGAYGYGTVFEATR